jgi:hypothetical protein
MRDADPSFHVERVLVAAIDCGATGEALLLRALLESMGAVVTLHQPGTPKDFLLVLGQGKDAPAFLVICGHGDENGLVFGEYAPPIGHLLPCEGQSACGGACRKRQPPRSGRVEHGL